MAKAQAVKIVRVPGMGRRMGRGAANLARRGGTAAARWAREEKHTIAAVGTGLVLGFLERPGTDGQSTASKLPHIAALGVPGTYGLGLHFAARFTKSHTLAHMATGLMTIAARDLARSGFGGTAVSGEGGEL